VSQSPYIALILPDANGMEPTLRAIRAVAVGAHVVAGRDAATVLGDVGPNLKGVFVHADQLEPALQGLRRAVGRTPVVVFTPETREQTLELALRRPQVVGMLAWGEGGARTWELMYLSRRLLASAEDAPEMNQLLPWGATTISWLPKTTDEQRKIVHRIETMCERLGVERRVGAAVSSAAHELLMNAMYDAPVGSGGKPRYAHDRTAQIELLPHEVPSLRFTVGGDWLALDAIDPFGRLPRNRFFEGVLRGHRSMSGAGGPALDTSHGGAGLGLHTLYMSGAVLRAELTPMVRTHVSWVYDRTASRRQRTKAPRSLYFLPNLKRRAKR